MPGPESMEGGISPEKEQESLDDKLEKLEEIENPSDRMMYILKTLDRECFPNEPLAIKKVNEIRAKYKGEKPPVASHCFQEDQEGNLINEHYEVNKEVNKRGKKTLDSELGVAFHEIRHRYQHSLDDLEIFTRENLKQISEKSPALALFKEKTGKTLEDFIKSYHSENLSKRDFDAAIVEDLSRSLLKYGVPVSQIKEKVIGKNAREIIKNIDTIIGNFSEG